MPSLKIKEIKIKGINSSYWLMMQVVDVRVIASTVLNMLKILTNFNLQ